MNLVIAILLTVFKQFPNLTSALYCPTVPFSARGSKHKPLLGNPDYPVELGEHELGRLA